MATGGGAGLSGEGESGAEEQEYSFVSKYVSRSFLDAIRDSIGTELICSRAVVYGRKPETAPPTRGAKSGRRSLGAPRPTDRMASGANGNASPRKPKGSDP